MLNRYYFLKADETHCMLCIKIIKVIINASPTCKNNHLTSNIVTSIQTMNLSIYIPFTSLSKFTKTRKGFN